MLFNKFLVAIGALVGSALFLYFFMIKKDSEKKLTGTVIILNGPSGSGKTSIQKEFQHLMMPHLWIKLGVDSLFDLPMPDINLENLATWQSENSIRWVTTVKDSQGNNVITLHVGEQGEHVVRGMNRAIAGYAREGCNVIVDYIAYKKEWLDDLAVQLDGVQTHWVKVVISLPTLEARETARGTSPSGHARSHYETVYADIKYDLEVNSESDSASQIARKIKEHFKL